ncbi:MAG: DNA repair protein RecN [Clostridiales bacterium]|nr:DNA repair protein RecN [Clostridiales bacterium]
MLLNVHVKNLALIEDVDVYFGEGLNILTGETGAGKSIIIGSINIALGGKIPKDIIRKNAEYALVELVFSIEDESILKALKNLSVEVEEDGTVIISRKITNGRSVIKINGETATAARLRDVAALLLDVHGQHDHESLLHKNKHLEILDSFLDKQGQTIKEEVSACYREYKELVSKLDDFTMDDETRSREISFLEFEIDEIEDASLQVGEDDELEEEQRNISGSAKLLGSLGEVYNLLSNEDVSVSNLLSQSASILSKISDYNKDTQSFYNSIMDMDSICQDLNHELSTYINSMTFDEERVNYVYERLNQINKLKMKHGRTITDILSARDKFADKLSNYKHYEEALASLNEKILIATNKLKGKCNELSILRKKTAEDLSENIIKVLETLNFQSVKFQVDFKENDTFTSRGNDVVEFMISTNVGEDVKPLSLVASGGELSRIMLGIKTILSEVDNIETLIFDEIDTGISGRTAQMVAEKLNIISKNHQIICITHLPQIAAMADNHYLIEKNFKDEITKTQITKLDNEAAINELARILGGAAITDAVMENAREMKKMALQTK